MFNLFKKHCQICGMDVEKEKAIKLFGVYVCSEEHAQEYRKQVQKENANRKAVAVDDYYKLKSNLIQICVVQKQC